MPLTYHDRHRRSGRSCWLAAILASSCMVLPAGRALAGSVETWTSADALPSFKVLKGTPISPTLAGSYYGAATTATDGLCRDYAPNSQICPSGSRPRSPELRELARALSKPSAGNPSIRVIDPDLVYEYVRNAVTTEFIFGLHKGAMGAIIDKSGGAFDQANLMVEVLREGGVTARYRFGQIALTGQQFYDWSGVRKAKAACELLAGGGIPATVNGSSTTCDLSGDVSTVSMAHVWVEADIGGQTYQFDPSFKPSEQRSGIDVRAAMGLQGGQVLSDAAVGVSRSTDGKVTSSYNLNGVSSRLSSYADTLGVRLAAADMNGASLTDVIGGSVLIPADRPVGGWRQASLPYATGGVTWTNIPDKYRTVLTFSATNLAGASLLSAPFFLDEVYGRPLQINSAAVEGVGNAPVLYFDGAKLKQGGAFPLTATEPTYTFIGRLTVDHPFAAASGAQSDGALERKLILGAPILIVHGWGATSPNLASKWSAETAVSGWSDANGAPSSVETSELSGARPGWPTIQRPPGSTADWAMRRSLPCTRSGSP